MSQEIIKLFPYKLFVSDSGKYMFTSKNNRLLKLSDKVYAVLERATEDFIIYLPIDKHVLEVLQAGDVVRGQMDVGNTEMIENRGQELQSIILMTIQDCNLNCKYCYGEGGQYKDKGIMQIDTAKRAVDFLINNCGDRKKVDIVFFGGEPLLNLTLIKAIVEYAKEIEQKRGIYFGMSITTNATLLTKEVQEYLEDNNISIKISIDGPKEVNDNMRVFPDGRGSFDRIMKNTEGLRKEGKASARATITSAFLNTKIIEKFLYESGFNDVGIAYAVESFDEEDYEKVYNISCEYIDEISGLIHNGKYNEIRYGYTSIFAYLSHIHSSVIGCYPCGVGRTMVAIDKDGRFFPCQRFVGVEKYQLGNLEKGLHNDAFLEAVNVLTHKKCEKCWCRNLCLGKCPYDNYAVTGTVDEPSDISCRLIKRIYERIILLYISLSDEEKRNLFH